MEEFPECGEHEEFRDGCAACLAEAFEGCFTDILIDLPGTTMEIAAVEADLVTGWVVYGDLTIMKVQYALRGGPSVEVPGHDWHAFREAMVWQAALTAERLNTNAARRTWAEVRSWEAHLRVPEAGVVL
jgi:hypothetical protein